MSERKLHAMPDLDDADRDVVRFYLDEELEQKWDSTLQAESDDEDRTVSVQGVIGYPEWADGTTAKMVEKRLKQLGKGDVVVNVNSPGGDFFHGQAIHNLLRAHDGKVTMQVIGIAASAASVVAMAGDLIRMPKTSWMMIHNTWGITIGNRHDHAKQIRVMQRFDEVSADLYAERSGQTFRAVMQMMDDETFLSGQDAVDKGFADELMSEAKTKSAGKKQSVTANARQMIVQALQKGGWSRAQARGAVAQLSGMPRAAAVDMPRAVEMPPTMSATVAEVRQALAGLASAAKP